MDRAELKLKLPLLVGAIPFLLAGLDGFARGKPLFGTLDLMLGLINLIAARFVGRTPTAANIALFLTNAGLAAVMSWNYFEQDKRTLPYAWIVVAAGFLVAAVVSSRRTRPEAAPSGSSAFD